MTALVRLCRMVTATWTLASSGSTVPFGRAAYLTCTLAVTVAAWLGLSAMASPFVQTTHTSRDNEVVVRNARRGQPLPKRYADRIAALPGALDTSYLDLQIVTCNTAGNTVTLNAIGGAGTHRAVAQEGASANDWATWHADPLGILIDAETAKQCGWRVGMGVSPPDISDRPLELHISGMTKSSKGAAMAHYAYVNRVASIVGQDKVTAIYTHAATAQGNDALAARIETAFAHDDPPVEAHPDTINQNAWARFGKVQYLLATVVLAVFLCCALVMVSVFAHAAAQRRTRMALLRVLGFPRRQLFSAWTLEAAMIALTGTVFGVLLGQGAIRVARRALGSVLDGLAPPAWAWGTLPVGVLLLMTSTLVVPARVLARVQPRDCQGA